jgi:hypothetical protein
VKKAIAYNEMELIMTAKSLKVEASGLCCFFPVFQIYEKKFSYFSKKIEIYFNKRSLGP